MINGKIIKGIGGFYYVDTENGLYECRARGIFRKNKITPLVGDRVSISVVDEENKKTVLQIVAAWKKIYKNNGVELMVIPSGQQASEEKVQEIQNEITTGEGPDVFFAEGCF